MRRNKGFTLIELLIVIAILGILAAVLFVSLSGAPKQKANDSRRATDAGQLQLAVEMYYNDNNAYPSSFSDLVTAGLIASVPKDPMDGQTDPSGDCTGAFNGKYVYVYATSGTPATAYVIGVCMQRTAAQGNSVFTNSYSGTDFSTVPCDKDHVYCLKGGTI